VKTLKVGIASVQDMKKRTMAIARGELKPSRADPKVWFTSPESFAKVLSNKNRALLNLISATHPDSLQTLAARTGRKASNLSRTLRTMERYGFVRLHKARAAESGLKCLTVRYRWNCRWSRRSDFCHPLDHLPPTGRRHASFRRMKLGSIFRSAYWWCTHDVI
jgi:predicted transcriptional regulator